MNKEIQTYIEDLLKHLAELIPNENNAKHGIHLNEDGQLAISILFNGIWQTVSFDDEYIDISAFDLAKDISKYFIK